MDFHVVIIKIFLPFNFTKDNVFNEVIYYMIKTTREESI
jgi:hypothetical protein